MRGERLSVLMGSVPLHTTKIFPQSHDLSHMVWLAQPHVVAREQVDSSKQHRLNKGKTPTK